MYFSYSFEISGNIIKSPNIPMSDHEPKTGFSPHGTPLSSLGVTTSSSSEGVPVAQPKRALPAVPAVPTLREQSGSPASSRKKSSERSCSDASTDNSALRRQIINQRLQAQVELAQAKLALAESQEEELLEQGSQRSSRSSRSLSLIHI